VKTESAQKTQKRECTTQPNKGQTCEKTALEIGDKMVEVWQKTARWMDVLSCENLEMDVCANFRGELLQQNGT
jgi:hypothetical protein